MYWSAAGMDDPGWPLVGHSYLFVQTGKLVPWLRKRRARYGDMFHVNARQLRGKGLVFIYDIAVRTLCFSCTLCWLTCYYRRYQLACNITYDVEAGCYRGNLRFKMVTGMQL